MAPRFENPIPDILEATDAAAKIVSIQSNLFVLQQELKTLRQLKRTLWIGASLIFLNLLLTLSFYWLGVGLHEKGWSANSLALLCILVFGGIIGLLLLAAQNAGRKT